LTAAGKDLNEVGGVNAEVGKNGSGKSEVGMRKSECGSRKKGLKLIVNKNANEKSPGNNNDFGSWNILKWKVGMRN
jgi:hypothetical protein